MSNLKDIHSMILETVGRAMYSLIDDTPADRISYEEALHAWSDLYVGKNCNTPEEVMKSVKYRTHVDGLAGCIIHELQAVHDIDGRVNEIVSARLDEWGLNG